MLKLINDLKKLDEVQNNSWWPETDTQVLKRLLCLCADYLIKGAGEYRFPMLLKQIKEIVTDQEELLQDSCNKMIIYLLQF